MCSNPEPTCTFTKLKEEKAAQWYITNKNYITDVIMEDLGMSSRFLQLHFPTLVSGLYEFEKASDLRMFRYQAGRDWIIKS